MKKISNVNTQTNYVKFEGAKMPPSEDAFKKNVKKMMKELYTRVSDNVKKVYDYSPQKDIIEEKFSIDGREYVLSLRKLSKENDPEQMKSFLTISVHNTEAGLKNATQVISEPLDKKGILKQLSNEKFTEKIADKFIEVEKLADNLLDG